MRFKEVVPQGIKVTLLADRGFGDQKLFELLRRELGFEFIIRIRGNITVTSNDGVSRPAEEWVGKGGRAKLLRNAGVTLDGYEVPTVVCVHAKGMKEPWCLVASDGEAKARAVINGYAKRWTIDIDQPLCLLKSLFALVEQLNDLPRPASWRIAQRA